MALSPEAISVMQRPAIEPVRVVGGYEAAEDIEERARLTLQDMEDCGAYDRRLICIGSPTGVGYFNYSIAEAIEYLTLGDCAIVVPQYARWFRPPSPSRARSRRSSSRAWSSRGPPPAGDHACPGPAPSCSSARAWAPMSRSTSR